MKNRTITLMIVSVLATLPCAATAAGPEYRISNDGDEVIIEAIEPAPQTTSPVDAAQKKIQSAAIAELLQLYTESFKLAEQAKILETVSQRSVRSIRDMQALLSFFLKDDQNARLAAENSLRRLSAARDAAYADFFIRLLEDEDPKLRQFALLGIDRLRPNEALPLLYAEANKPFDLEEPSLRTAPTPANNWQARYLAVNVLAAWEGKKAFKIIEKRISEAPRVAKLASTHLWEEFLPTLLKWSRSKKPGERTRAGFGWQGIPPVSALKATRETLREVLEDDRYDHSIRHEAAVKFGLASEPTDVDRLLARRAEARDEKTRLLFETAVFASQDARAVPILRKYVLEHPDPSSRAAALTQLSGMLEPGAYKKLLQEMADHDPDEENRERAQKTLELSK